MLGAVPQQASVAYPGKADLKVPLGVEPAQHQRFPGEQSHKADIVVLGHGVVCGDKVVVFDLLDRQAVASLGLCGTVGASFLPQQVTPASAQEQIRFPQWGQT